MSGRSNCGLHATAIPTDRTRIIEEAGLEIHGDQTDAVKGKDLVIDRTQIRTMN